MEKNDGIRVGTTGDETPPARSLIPVGSRVQAVVNYPSSSSCIMAGFTGTLVCYDPNDPVLPYLVDWDDAAACTYTQCQVCGVCATSGWWVGFGEIEIIDDQPNPESDWGFLVYLDGDNNLEGAGIDDFLEMASAGSNSSVRILVQFDRVNGFDTTYGNWTSCKRFLVSSGMTPTSENAIEDIGECNMGDPATLTGFIDWATDNYPATNYALVLWNHGGGWREEYQALIEAAKLAKSAVQKEEIRARINALEKPDFKAVCWDDTNGGDSLRMREVKDALNDATSDMDLVGFDACLMGMLEVAYEIKDTGASVMVGPEETEPWDGWPYDTILSDLVSNPNFSAAQLGESIVDNCYASYPDGQTQAAVDLSRMDVLANSLNILGQTIIDSWDTDMSAVSAAATSVLQEIDAAVLYEQHGSGWPGAHGLAVYFPATQWGFSADYNGSVIDLPGQTSWDEFLQEYYTSMSGSMIETARTNSQAFYYPEHIDLYNFCDNLLVEETEPCIDNDQDGYGNPASDACLYPEEDCNDNDWRFHPRAREIADGEDLNCGCGGYCAQAGDFCDICGTFPVEVKTVTDSIPLFAVYLIPVGYLIVKRRRIRHS